MFLSEIFNLQRELDRLFSAEYSPYSTFSKRVYPALNLFEKDDKLVIKSEMPGLSKKDLSVTLEDDIISLQGEVGKSSKDDLKIHRRERLHGTFNRSFKLPYKVDPEKIEATLNDGVLTITLERDESTKARSISIQ